MAADAKQPVVISGKSETASPAPAGDVWDHVAAMDDFKRLLAARVKFVIPAVIVFVVYYFLLPISVGYFPQFMDKRIGPVNLAYLFALSQFFVAWLIAWLYVRAARKFDEFGSRIIQNVDQRNAQGGR
jgi:uncharacterized membrane protein (DUF485 family)